MFRQPSLPLWYLVISCPPTHPIRLVTILAHCQSIISLIRAQPAQRVCGCNAYASTSLNQNQQWAILVLNTIPFWHFHKIDFSIRSIGGYNQQLESKIERSLVGINRQPIRVLYKQVNASLDSSIVYTLTLSRRILPGIEFSLLAILNPLPSHSLMF